jgi:hypothetical protein
LSLKNGTKNAWVSQSMDIIGGSKTARGVVGIDCVQIARLMQCSGHHLIKVDALMQ